MRVGVYGVCMLKCVSYIGAMRGFGNIFGLVVGHDVSRVVRNDSWECGTVCIQR